MAWPVFHRHYEWLPTVSQAKAKKRNVGQFILYFLTAKTNQWLPRSGALCAVLAQEIIK